MPDVTVSTSRLNVNDLCFEGSGTPSGCDQINSAFPGGLRGLQPPATFFATLRVAEVSQLHTYRLNGFQTRSQHLDHRAKARV